MVTVQTDKTVYLKIMWKLERMKRMKSQNQRVMKILSLIILMGRIQRPSNLTQRQHFSSFISNGFAKILLNTS